MCACACALHVASKCIYPPKHAPGMHPPGMHKVCIRHAPGVHPCHVHVPIHIYVTSHLITSTSLHCRAAGAKGTVLRSSSRRHPPATQAVVVSRGLAGINLPCARSQCTMTGQQLISNAHAHCCYMHARASLQFASRVELATRVVSVARVVADPPPIGAGAGAGIGAEAPPSWLGHHLSSILEVDSNTGVAVTVGVKDSGA